MIYNTKLCEETKAAINRSSVKRYHENVALIKINQNKLSCYGDKDDTIETRALLIAALKEK